MFNQSSLNGYNVFPASLYNKVAYPRSELGEGNRREQPLSRNGTWSTSPKWMAIYLEIIARYSGIHRHDRLSRLLVGGAKPVDR